MNCTNFRTLAITKYPSCILNLNVNDFLQSKIFWLFYMWYSKLLSDLYPRRKMILQIRHCLCCYSLEGWWEVPCPIPASSGSQAVIVSSGHKYSEGLPCRLVCALEEGRGHSISLPDCTNTEMMEWVEESFVSESLLT